MPTLETNDKSWRENRNVGTTTSLKLGILSVRLLEVLLEAKVGANCKVLGCSRSFQI